MCKSTEPTRVSPKAIAVAVAAIASLGRPLAVLGTGVLFDFDSMSRSATWLSSSRTISS
jgi:hypothetical protein